MHVKKNILILCAAGTVLTLGLPARAAAAAAHAAPAVLAVTNTRGAVELVMMAEPAEVRFDRDLLLTFRVKAPENTAVRLPDIAPRLTGFVLAGEFARAPAVAGGMRVQEHCFRLTPVISDEYRLGPLAVACAAAGADAGAGDWLITRPLDFAPPAIINPMVGDIRGPRRVLPPWRTILGRAAGAALLAAGAWLAWRLCRRIRQAWRVRQMSPRQRALYELEQLLTSRLRAAGRQKEFFAALALIVRRYIERAHAIRAPEQTTEEFLLTVSADARFSRAVLEKLAEFLRNADLVKFAAWQPGDPVAERAVQTAREYIETDAC